MKLYDYTNGVTEVDVDLEDENIAVSIMEVISGDEVLTLVLKDGTEIILDSDSNERFQDFLDDSYVVTLNGVWQIDKKEFLSRKSSYWRG